LQPAIQLFDPLRSRPAFFADPVNDVTFLDHAELIPGEPLDIFRVLSQQEDFLLQSVVFLPHLLIGRAQLGDFLPHFIIVDEAFFPEQNQETHYQKDDQDQSSSKLHRLVPVRPSAVAEVAGGVMPVRIPSTDFNP
jgi:hypothetical protein